MYTLAWTSISSEAFFTSAVERSIGVMTVCVLVAVVCVSAPTFIYIYIKKGKYELLCGVFFVPYASVNFLSLTSLSLATLNLNSIINT